MAQLLWPLPNTNMYPVKLHVGVPPSLVYLRQMPLLHCTLDYKYSYCNCFMCTDYPPLVSKLHQVLAGFPFRLLFWREVGKKGVILCLREACGRWCPVLQWEWKGEGSLLNKIKIHHISTLCYMVHVECVIPRWGYQQPHAEKSNGL